MKPPYQITNKTIELIASISEKIGEVNSAYLYKPPTELRRRNRIKTIQSSLEIEGNSLTLEQVTAILENRRVIAPKNDILEVKNAIKAYEELEKYNPASITAFCRAHAVLMDGLVDNPGKIRTTSVGIARGLALTHVAPPGNIVRSLVKALFDYLKNGKDLLLIKSCVFHYEIEFIHPFIDGNGRMGRLWQTVILIRSRQSEYYKILGESDNLGESTGFIEFMLEIIDESLKELLITQNVNIKNTDRISIFKELIRQSYFSRQSYMRQFKNISPATASRDLKMAVENGFLEKQGDKRTTLYKFKK
jgi:Fic family protein